MRKLMTVAMGFAAMLLASCAGSTTESNNASVEADVQEKMETILSGIESNDVDAVVATLEETKEKVEELLAEGKSKRLRNMQSRSRLSMKRMLSSSKRLLQDLLQFQNSLRL
jgi:uncharacterized protein YaaQ